jgi:hypothetical protein
MEGLEEDMAAGNRDHGVPPVGGHRHGGLLDMSAESVVTYRTQMARQGQGTTILDTSVANARWPMLKGRPTANSRRFRSGQPLRLLRDPGRPRSPRPG